jgi:DNA-binding NarL/FixJ family response regulator
MNPGDIKVFLVAENRLLREALGKMLQKRDGLHVVGAAAFSDQTPERVAGADPNILLLDSAVSSSSGLHMIAQLRKAAPSLKVIMIGMTGDSEVFLQAVRGGVQGYMLKEASAAEIIAGVRAVANGEAVCPPNLCMALFDHVATQGTPLPGFHIRQILGLTRREQQLVHMIARGLTNKEISSELNLSENTVKNHVHRMLRKVGANDRLGAVELCRLQGLPA